MSAHTTRWVKTLAACLWLAGPARAEITPVVPTAAAGLSERIRDAIRAGLPKYQLQPANDDVRMIESSERAVERDGVLRLPTVTVEARTQPRIDGYEMLTPKGRMELALKKYPGIKLGNLFGLNNGIALALLQEEIEAQKREEMRDLVERVSTGGGAEDKVLNDLLKDATTRIPQYWLQGRKGR